MSSTISSFYLRLLPSNVAALPHPCRRRARCRVPGYESVKFLHFVHRCHLSTSPRRSVASRTAFAFNFAFPFLLTLPRRILVSTALVNIIRLAWLRQRQAIEPKFTSFLFACFRLCLIARRQTEPPRRCWSRYSLISSFLRPLRSPSARSRFLGIAASVPFPSIPSNTHVD